MFETVKTITGWVGRRWCRARHNRLMGPRMAAVVRCGECGREHGTPWAGEQRAGSIWQGDRLLLPGHGRENEAPPNSVNAPSVWWFIGAGAAVGVLVAGAIMGAVCGMVWGRQVWDLLWWRRDRKGKGKG